MPLDREAYHHVNFDDDVFVTLLSSDKNTRRNGTVGSVRSNVISNLPKRLTLKDNKW